MLDFYPMCREERPWERGWVVTMHTSLRERPKLTLILNNAERGEQTFHSAPFNIRDNKRNVEWLLKQSLSIALRIPTAHDFRVISART